MRELFCMRENSLVDPYIVSTDNSTLSRLKDMSHESYIYN